MRDVATTADVALGTIYRYFSSKDHLLAEAPGRVGARPRRAGCTPGRPQGGTIADRVVEVLRRATRAMEAEPQLSEAVVTALASTDPHAARCQAEIGAAMAETLMALAFPDDFDPADRATTSSAPSATSGSRRSSAGSTTGTASPRPATSSRSPPTSSSTSTTDDGSGSRGGACRRLLV